MYILKPSKQFKQDFKRVKKDHPELIKEVLTALKLLREQGKVPEKTYNLHILNNPNLNYFGTLECHLADGKVDLLLIYQPHKTNPVIRLVRLGSHKELFHW